MKLFRRRVTDTAYRTPNISAMQCLIMLEIWDTWCSLHRVRRHVDEKNWMYCDVSSKRLHYSTGFNFFLVYKKRFSKIYFVIIIMIELENYFFFLGHILFIYDNIITEECQTEDDLRLKMCHIYSTIAFHVHKRLGIEILWKCSVSFKQFCRPTKVMAHSTYWIEGKIIFHDFYFLSYGWLYLKFTVTHQECRLTKKK